MGILTKIKQKPDGQKKIISLITAVILTLIIVVVWFSFNSKENQVAEERDKLSSISPVQVIKDEFSKVFSSFKENIQASSSVSTTPVTIPVEIVNEEASSSSTTTDKIN